uniref:Uncharacterized protein n=1 Tax=Anguilla anguilla TaxID=7936 RepID=A0A0E9XB15_ANGAN
MGRQLVPQEESTIGEGSTTYGTFRYSRNNKEACTLRTECS